MKQPIPLFLAIACMLPSSGLAFAVQEPEPETTAPAETPSAEDVFDALEVEVDAAYETWRKELREKIDAAEKSGEDLPMTAYTPPLAQFVPKFQAAAADYAGTDDAVRFLSWIARQGIDHDREAGKQAYVTLIDVHLQSESFRRLATLLPGLPRYFDAAEARALIAKVEQNSTDSTVRAWAVLARLGDTLDKSAIDSDAFLTAKREMYAALEGVDDPYLRSMVGEKIDLREKFAIGMVAPDIVGIDIDGVAFKLSDYKGKVIFLDFWGDW